MKEACEVFHEVPQSPVDMPRRQTRSFCFSTDPPRQRILVKRMTRPVRVRRPKIHIIHCLSLMFFHLAPVMSAGTVPLTTRPFQMFLSSPGLSMQHPLFKDTTRHSADW